MNQNRPTHRHGVIALCVCLSGCATLRPDTESYVIRLKPGQELKTEVDRLAHERRLQAASITSAVGSLTDVSLRLANRDETTHYTGHFEVVSLSGYLADGEFHVHMAVSDGDGRTMGGHVTEGNIVYTTLVIVIQEHLRYRYRREMDESTHHAELVIDKR